MSEKKWNLQRRFQKAVELAVCDYFNECNPDPIAQEEYEVFEKIFHALRPIEILPRFAQDEHGNVVEINNDVEEWLYQAIRQKR